MITEEQLKEAIAECNGQRHPNADTCIKLASYYTIRNEMFPKNTPLIEPAYSYAAPVADSVIDYDGDSDFAKAVNGRDINEILRKIDDVLVGVYVVEPALYRKIMRDLTE